MTEATIQIQAEHLGSKLLDFIIPERYITSGANVSTILQALLDYQPSAYITLGGVDGALDISIPFSCEWCTIAKGCFLVQELVGGYMYVDNSNALWLKTTQGDDTGQQIRYQKNLEWIRRTDDYTGLATKLYPLGYGQGENQLKLSHNLVVAETATEDSDVTYGYLTLGGTYSAYQGWTAAGDALPSEMIVYEDDIDVSADWEQGADDQTLRCAIGDYNAGSVYTITYRHADYLKASTFDTYGEVHGIATNKEIKSASNLLRYGRLVLADAEYPIYTYEVKALDLSQVDGGLSFEALQVGSTVTIIDEDLGINVSTQIVRLETPEMGRSAEINIELSNKVQDLSSELARDDRRLNTNEHTSDGYTNILVFNDRDACDATHPFVLDFWIHPEAVRSNCAVLTWKLRNFWAYAQGAASGGSSTPTSSSGGGQTPTSSSGGGQTTSSGGSSTPTSSSGGGQTTSSGGSSTPTSSQSGSHNHIIFNQWTGPPGSTTPFRIASFQDKDSRNIHVFQDGAETGDFYTSYGQEPAHAAHVHSVPLTDATSGNAVTYESAAIKCSGGGSFNTGNPTATISHTGHWQYLPFSTLTDWEVHTYAMKNSGSTLKFVGILKDVNDDDEDLYCFGSEGDHTHTVTISAHDHTVQDHTHTVTIAAHTHTVSDHTHTVTVAAHTHTVTIAAHTHNLTFGIYEGGTASSVDVYVDDNLAASGVTSHTDFDITDYMDKTAGLPAPGWHTVRFEPDANTRIVATLIVSMFISGHSLV